VIRVLILLSRRRPHGQSRGVVLRVVKHLRRSHSRSTVRV
jgi:hypothetical protein